MKIFENLNANFVNLQEEKKWEHISGIAEVRSAILLLSPLNAYPATAC